MKLWSLSATDIVELLKANKVSPSELLDEIEAGFQDVERAVNAVPTRCLERARAAAKALRRPENPGPGYLYGLPIVVKDSTPVKGVRWTSGSRIFEDRVAPEDDPHIENLERNGAIIVGKSNLPELGAGANTYNNAGLLACSVFGATRNPWDLAKTCGGSSGGTAAALASGEVWLGTGGDLGGSLRIPAAFCGVVGFRGSVGLVPQRYLGAEALHTISGPMARNVPDLALMLDAMTGQHPRDPLSLPAPATPFQVAIQQGSQAPLRRIAWSADLNRVSSTDPELARICQTAADWFEAFGVEVVNTCPDLSDADSIFQVLRADSFSNSFLAIKDDPELGPLLKPELHWQIDRGARQSRSEVEKAKVALGALQARIEAFFQDHELLLTPTTMTPPFDVETRWLRSHGGREFTNYVEWLLPTFAFSLADVPAISVPCGFTASGLPVGLQIVGPHRLDARVLFAAARYEKSHPWRTSVPTRDFLKT